MSLDVAGCCSSIVFSDTNPCRTRGDEQDAFISCMEDPTKKKGILKVKLLFCVVAVPRRMSERRQSLALPGPSCTDVLQGCMGHCSPQA